MSRIAADLQVVGVQRAVETGAAHVDLSRDLRAAQNHILEAGLVRAFGSHEQDFADLQSIGVQRAVETGAAHVDLSRDLRAAQIHVLEAGLVLAVGIHEQRATDLQFVGVQRAVETGAGHVDVAIDFSAVQTHVALEGCAIAQEQIALGMQTVGGEGAASSASHRARSSCLSARGST